MQRNRRTPWVWVIISLFLLAVIGGIGLLFILVAVSGSGVGKQVGVIELSGAISDEGARGLLGGRPSGAREFIEDVERARRDKSIKAVVIRINSPGGSAAASQEMYQAVLRLKQKKPVLCSMGDVAASGGYYVASGCEKIYANGSTLTGSIGVISEFMNFQGLLGKVGIAPDIIKSGKFKDAGNPARALTPEERQLFQSMIMNVYNQFVDDVVAGRKTATAGKLTRADVLKLADGRVYTGLQAKENRLIDEIGGLHEAVEAAGRLGGIKGMPKVKNYSRGGLFGSLAGADAESAVTQEVTTLSESAGAAFMAGQLKQLKAETGTNTSAFPQLK